MGPQSSAQESGASSSAAVRAGDVGGCAVPSPFAETSLASHLLHELQSMDLLLPFLKMKKLRCRGAVIAAYNCTLCVANECLLNHIRTAEANHILTFKREVAPLGGSGEMKLEG